VRGKRAQERQEREAAKERAEIQRRQQERAVTRTIQQLTTSLEETQPKALRQIERMVRQLGVEEALRYLAETERIEAEGGIMLPDGSRRRSKGGVFFFLVKQQLTQAGRTEDMKVIFAKD
jgi:phosphorylated adapter RNA export protein